MAEKEIMAKVFSGASKVYDFFVSLATFGGIHRWQKELIERMGEEGNWLDVGTGTGEVLLKLKNSDLKVGIDLALGMLRRAKEKCGDCYFLLADAENMPFKDKSFDRVSLSLVFRHLENKEKFLEEAKRVGKEKVRVGIIDIGRFKGTGVLILLMKTLLLPVGLLFFGRDKWEFFIKSLKESLSPEETRSMFTSFGFKEIYFSRKFLGLIYIQVFEKE
ncbi:class I SAM-dependent methyltransferase [Aquifex aeolicus]|uniref:Methyltransferase type 11 domain-containing protein n=1 Tax=Aquifex aeolicus (strain VF5) TaxID=224324 RepID=O66670_AQUAE|nr:class I SAM-dependent methyltransferase [Aquifex aeolicus]AAC06632.1 putative protein [Aquifex aeolicus VF5]